MKEPAAIKPDTTPHPVAWRGRWLFLFLGVLLGALIILAIRFATYSAGGTHYHANFAVYINDQREQFKGPQYYQAVSICNAGTGITTPQQRAHMHENINSVVHVHDHATTWGQFFENLGWFIGPDFVQTNDGTMYKAAGDDKLHVLINDQDYTDLTPITNTVIKDRDRLLVSYGNLSDSQLQQEYKTVPTTAAHYDTSKDPASCSTGEHASFSMRLHHLF